MKKYKQLTSEQRYAIYLGLKDGTSKKDIALLIGVHISTLYRELKRNKNKRGGYSWRLAHEMAGERKERLPGNRSTPERIKQKVSGLIREDWSPKQISGYLKKHENIAISHETIYKWIRKDRQNGGDLYKHCRHKLKHRKRPVGSAKNILNRTSIHERPEEADGSRFGDFEMDTIIGPNHSEAILTITERKTNYPMIKKLPILIVHGKKERLKMEINQSDNISQKGYRLKIIRMRISKKSGTNQTEDLERNWILIHQKMSFTNI